MITLRSSGARNVQTATSLDPVLRKDLQAVGLTLGRSLEVFADAVGGPRNAFYVPSSATFDRAENYAKDAPAVTAGALPAIRDLRLVDGATAQLAQTVGLQLADDDTVPRQE